MVSRKLRRHDTSGRAKEAERLGLVRYAWQCVGMLRRCLAQKLQRGANGRLSLVERRRFKCSRLRPIEWRKPEYSRPARRFVQQSWELLLFNFPQLYCCALLSPRRWFPCRGFGRETVAFLPSSPYYLMNWRTNS